MKHSTLLFAFICTALIFSATGAIAEDWQKASSCSMQAIGKAEPNSTENTYSYYIGDWKPGVKYVFRGELSWDPNLISTHGRIFLKKKGTTLNQRIADWSNPPINAVIEQDVTRYIDGNGSYTIEWQYMGGRSGVCIMRSEITPSD